jgi:hypothetical protein
LAEREVLDELEIAAVIGPSPNRATSNGKALISQGAPNVGQVSNLS